MTHIFFPLSLVLTTSINLTIQANTLLINETINNNPYQLSIYTNYTHTVSPKPSSTLNIWSASILFAIPIFIIINIAGYKALNTQKDPAKQRQVVEAAMEDFEKKAADGTILGDLGREATDLLATFKNNVHCIYAYKLKCDEFHFNNFTNKICKIKLYEGSAIAVTLHIFPEDFEENMEYHNHSKPMLLQNLCGEYIHTTWQINSNTSSGKLYKFAYERNQENVGEEIDGSLERMVIDNYKSGNWKWLHPAVIHTITAAPNTQRIISFVIKSKLDVHANQDRFVLSTQPTLDRPTLQRKDVEGTERDNILEYIIDAAQ